MVHLVLLHPGDARSENPGSILFEMTTFWAANAKGLQIALWITVGNVQMHHDPAYSSITMESMSRWTSGHWALRPENRGKMFSRHTLPWTVACKCRIVLNICLKVESDEDHQSFAAVQSEPPLSMFRSPFQMNSYTSIDLAFSTSQSTG